MQQPSDPYSQYQQSYNAPTSPHIQPPPYQYHTSPRRPSGFRNWFSTRSRKSKIGLRYGIMIAAFLLCICAASACGSNNLATTPTPTPTTGHVTILDTPTVNIPTDTPTLPPTPMPTPTRKPTPTPTLKPTPKPQPTQPPVQPTPTQQACQGVNNNPWCFDFNPGNLIYNPPSAFCNYFNCIANFWNGRGYVKECQDGMYSKSGGIQGSCSHHGGNLRNLYSH
jgi:hypothetical protein